MRLDAYIRVSARRGREGDSYQTKRHQRAEIEAYARLGKHRIVKWHEDEDWSGGEYHRPGLQDALARIEAGKSDGLIVAKLDRFARDVVDANTAMQRIAAADGQLIMVAERIDTTSYMGRFVFNIFAAVAEMELERIRESWTKHKADAVGRGLHICSRTPAGYLKDADGRLEPDPAIGPIVRRAFELRAGGATYSEIGDLLRDAGVNGRQAWNPSAIRALLRNRVYLGEARHGALVNADAHPPLVDEPTWQAAQRTTVGKRKDATSRLLSGLLRCAGCRYAMSPSVVTSRGQKLVAYRCGGHHASGDCPAPAVVLASVIEPEVERLVRDGLADLDVHRGAITDDEHSDALLRVRQAGEDLDAFIDVANAAGLDRDRLLRGIEQRQAILAEAQDDLARIEQSRSIALHVPDFSAIDSWADLPVERRREFLRRAVDCVFVFKGRAPIADRVDLLWRGEAPADLPSRGRKAALVPWDGRPAEVRPQVRG